MYIDDLPNETNVLTDFFLPANQRCFVFRILLMLVILGADQNDGSLWQRDYGLAGQHENKVIIH